MKKIFIISFIALTSIVRVKGQPVTMWQLLMDGTIIRWAYSGGDEFNGTQLDISKWYSCEDGWNREHGNELQYYLDNNIILDNGSLKLVAKKEPGNYDVWRFDGGPHIIQKYFDYTSGWIQTKMKYKYGLFEIRFKTPNGKGFWPAFWLYANHDLDEIDVFEMKGESPNKFKSGVICDNNNNGKNDCGGEWFTVNGNFPDGFNDMMCEWDPGLIIWYLNGNEYKFYEQDFNYTMSVRANLAIANDSGPFEPGPDNSTPFPSNFEIDFIRVWTRLDCGQTINISNYNQVANDPTVITGENINTSNLTLNQDQYLKLIATYKIVINPESHISGEFSAKIVDCPNPQKSIINTQHTEDTLQVISSLGSDSIRRINNKQLTSNIENSPILYTKIYPNPSDGKITIEFVGKIERNIKIELLNSKGQPVYSKDNINETIIGIDISNLPIGIYLLKGSFENNSITEKIVLY